MLQPRLRVALVSVRFALFDAQMPRDFRDRMHAHERRAAGILERHFEVVATGVVEDEAGASRAAEQLERQRIDAVVFAPAMAAPPRYAEIVLAAMPAPVVIWNAPAVTDLGRDLDQAGATEHTTTVGALMFANVLVRRGSRPPVVTAALADEASLELLVRTVRAVAVAGSLRGSTVIRIGDPIPGYADVQATPGDLAALGVAETSIPLAAWESALDAVRPAAAAAYLLSMRESGWKGDPGPQAERSARVACALRAVLDEEGAVGGTVNCHGPFFRNSQRVGVVACLGVASETARGRPLSCTGDQPTGVLLVLARRVAGAALYCECYAPDLTAGLMLVAGGGEGDPASADTPSDVTLRSNEHYPGEHGEGSSIDFTLRVGPATLLSLSPTDDGWVLPWATGEITESRYPHMRGPNGMFRFDSGDIGAATSRWIASGATHHNALVPGRLDVEIPAMADALGIRSVRV